MEASINFQLLQKEANIQIEFANNTSLKEFEATNKSELKEKLKKIQFSNQNSNYLCKEESLLYIIQKLLDKIQKKISCSPIKGVQNCFPIQLQYGESSQNQNQSVLDIDCQLQQPTTNEMKHYYIKFIESFWEGKPSIIGICSNVSEQIIIKRLQNLDQYKDQLLATVTHDLKTPLNGIISIVQSTLLKVTNKDIQQNLTIILKNAQLLLSLIMDILDYSQIQKGVLRIQPKHFYFQQCFQEVKELLGYSAQQKGIQLKYQQDNFVNSQILHTDFNRLKQILINFVSNSLKYTLSGSITVQTQVNLENNTIINVSIIDTGVGIPDNVLKNLFQSFGTFDHLAGSNTQGIGLGLVICKKIIELLGPSSKVSIQSEINKGSEFCFEIYRDIQQKDIQINNNENIEKDFLNTSIDYNAILSEPLSIQEKINQIQQKTINSSLNYFKQTDYQDNNITLPSVELKYKVLVVDDEVFNILAMKSILQSYNSFLIDEAYNGMQALEMISKIQYDIIFLDDNMPIMNGKQVATKIKEFVNQKIITPVKIIVVTAFDLENQHNIYKEAGFDFFLSKPFTVDSLEKILQDLNLEFSQNKGKQNININ